MPPLVSPAAFDRLLVPVNLGIGLGGGAGGRVAVGRWYPAQDQPGDLRDHPPTGPGVPGGHRGAEGPRCGPRSGRVRGPRLSRGLRPRAVRPRLSRGHRPPACRLVRHGPPGGPRRRLDGTGRHRDDRATGQDRDAEPDGGQPCRRDVHRWLQARARRFQGVRPGHDRPRQPLRLRRERRRSEQAPAGARHGRRLRRRPGRPQNVDQAGRRPSPTDRATRARTASPSWSATRARNEPSPAPASGTGAPATGPVPPTSSCARCAPGSACRSRRGSSSSSTATSRARRPPRWRASSRPAAAATRCCWT